MLAEALYSFRKSQKFGGNVGAQWLMENLKEKLRKRKFQIATGDEET